MKAAIDQFRENISRVRNLDLIFKSLNTRKTSTLDITDLLRAEFVLAVSALDHFIHELVRLGMLEISQGLRQASPAFDRFTISMNSVRQALTLPTNYDWLDNEIRLQHSWKSFQLVDKIADAIRLISDIKLWDEVSIALNKPIRDLKNQLNLIVDRRNKIAHEADMDPSYPGNRWPINDALVSESVIFIEEIAETIYKIITSTLIITKR